MIEILSRELHERGSQHEPNPINFSVSPEKYQDINNSLSPLLTDLTAPPSLLFRSLDLGSRHEKSENLGGNSPTGLH